MFIANSRRIDFSKEKVIDNAFASTLPKAPKPTLCQRACIAKTHREIEFKNLPTLKKALTPEPTLQTIN